MDQLNAHLTETWHKVIILDDYLTKVEKILEYYIHEWIVIQKDY